MAEGVETPEAPVDTLKAQAKASTADESTKTTSSNPPAWMKPDFVKDRTDQPIRKDFSVRPKTEVEIMMEQQAKSNRIREDLLGKQKESA